MFRNLNRKFHTKKGKNNKGQQTAEYALLIVFAVAAVIAMQTYAQRTIQARIRDASKYLVQQTNRLGLTEQYEPYYLSTNMVIVRDEVSQFILENQVARTDMSTNRIRESGAIQKSDYGTQFGAGLVNGL